MKKVLFLMLFLMVLGAAGTNAQVRIGGDGEPHTAAVLDLNTNNDATPAGNKGGLALPRVELINNTTQLNSAAPTKGMLVYNTKVDMVDGQGTGVYYWNGSVWMVVAGEVGVAGTVKGTSGTDYRTWCFPAYTKLGCWTVDNSKEGTNSATTYTGYADGWLGYYYTWTQAAGACSAIPDYELPNQAQWTALINYINSPKSTAIEHIYWTQGRALAGLYDASSSTWFNWGILGLWWSSGASGQAFYTYTGLMYGPNPNTTNYFSVRCVKN